MAKLYYGFIVAGIILGGKLVSFQPDMPDTLQGREEVLAQRINKAAPAPLRSYSFITGAKVSNGTLELDVSISSAAVKLATDGSFRTGIVVGTCKGPVFSDLLKRGGLIRFVFTAADGSRLSPVTIRALDCPTT